MAANVSSSFTFSKSLLSNDLVSFIDSTDVFFPMRLESVQTGDGDASATHRTALSLNNDVLLLFITKGRSIWYVALRQSRPPISTLKSRATFTVLSIEMIVP